MKRVPAKGSNVAIDVEGATATPDEALPWSTEPQELGSATCGWCHRDIYVPAVPCSARPVDGLAHMDTAPGFGQRCQYELATRRPYLLTGAEAAFSVGQKP